MGGKHSERLHEILVHGLQTRAQMMRDSHGHLLKFAAGFVVGATSAAAADFVSNTVVSDAINAVAAASINHEAGHVADRRRKCLEAE